MAQTMTLLEIESLRKRMKSLEVSPKKAPFKLNADQQQRLKHEFSLQAQKAKLSTKQKRKEIIELAEYFNSLARQKGSTQKEFHLNVNHLKSIMDKVFLFFSFFIVTKCFLIKERAKVEESSQVLAEMMVKHADAKDGKFDLLTPPAKPLNAQEAIDVKKMGDALCDLWVSRYNFDMAMRPGYNPDDHFLRFANTLGTSKKPLAMNDMYKMMFDLLKLDAMRSREWSERVDNDHRSDDIEAELDEYVDWLSSPSEALDPMDTSQHYIGPKFSGNKTSKNKRKRRICSRKLPPMNPKGSEEMDEYYHFHRDMWIQYFHTLLDEEKNLFQPLPEYRKIWNETVKPLILSLLRQCHSSYNPERDEDPDDPLTQALKGDTLLKSSFLGPKIEPEIFKKKEEESKLAFTWSVVKGLGTLLVVLGMGVTIIHVGASMMHEKLVVSPFMDPLNELNKPVGESQQILGNVSNTLKAEEELLKSLGHNLTNTNNLAQLNATLADHPTILLQELRLDAQAVNASCTRIAANTTLGKVEQDRLCDNLQLELRQQWVNTTLDGKMGEGKLKTLLTKLRKLHFDQFKKDKIPVAKPKLNVTEEFDITFGNLYDFSDLTFDPRAYLMDELPDKALEYTEKFLSKIAKITSTLSVYEGRSVLLNEQLRSQTQRVVQQLLENRLRLNEQLTQLGLNLDQVNELVKRKLPETYRELLENVDTLDFVAQHQISTFIKQNVKDGGDQQATAAMARLFVQMLGTSGMSYLKTVFLTVKAIVASFHAGSWTTVIATLAGTIAMGWCTGAMTTIMTVGGLAFGLTTMGLKGIVTGANWLWYNSDLASEEGTQTYEKRQEKYQKKRDFIEKHWNDTLARTSDNDTQLKLQYMIERDKQLKKFDDEYFDQAHAFAKSVLDWMDTAFNGKLGLRNLVIYSSMSSTAASYLSNIVANLGISSIASFLSVSTWLSFLWSLLSSLLVMIFPLLVIALGVYTLSKKFETFRYVVSYFCKVNLESMSLLELCYNTITTFLHPRYFPINIGVTLAMGSLFLGSADVMYQLTQGNSIFESGPLLSLYYGPFKTLYSSHDMLTNSTTVAPTGSGSLDSFIDYVHNLNHVVQKVTQFNLVNTSLTPVEAQVLDATNPFVNIF